MLMATSSLGVLIREGLALGLGPSHANILRNYDPLFLNLGGNMLGCWIQGLIIPIAAFFSETMYASLTLGFCSAITTYCAWNQTIAALFYDGHVLRGAAALLLGLFAPYCAMLCGVFMGRCLNAHCCQNYKSRPTTAGPTMSTSNVMSVVSVLVLGAVAAVAIAESVKTDRHGHGHPLERRMFVAACLGPIGTLLRGLIARLNKDNGGFLGVPWGTLIANLLASILYAVMMVVQSRSRADRAWLPEAFAIGLFGCLSTLSTFVVEIEAQARDTKTFVNPPLYLVSSLALSVSMGCVVMLGSKHVYVE